MFSAVTRGLFALSLLALVSACSTPLQAVMDFDHRYDFTGVEKIALQPISRADAGAALISDMEVNRISQALSEELTRKGLQVVQDNSEADLLLAWHLVTQEKTDVRTYNSMSYYNCWRCGPMVNDVTVRQYTEGTLIVDLIDPSRNQSVWRATVQSRLSSRPDPESDKALRYEAARAVFAEFPPPSS